jgi:nicotinamide riboside kinase
MANDNEIGRVVAVDTAQVTIELNKDIKALTRSTYEGTFEVGCINSYIIIPIGGKRIVAMITRVVLTEDSELKADKTMVSLPSSRRLMKATMIGTIEDSSFKQGISVFPVLDTPVLIATKNDLDAIFGKNSRCNDKDCDDPGYCIPIGKSAIFSDYDIKINPDAFFGKHAAIIGSTGSGKSCTIATILQSILEQPDVKQTNIVILDTNGEYRSAFQKENSDGKWYDALPKAKSLYIPSDQKEVERLIIPYWFMDSDDFTRLFRAQPGVQRPVLLKAISTARDVGKDCLSWVQIRYEIILELNRILGYSTGNEKADSKCIRQLCEGLITYVGTQQNEATMLELSTEYPEVSKEILVSSISQIKDIVREGISSEGTQYESYAVIDMNKRQRIHNIVNPLLSSLTKPSIAISTLNQATSDTPKYFSKFDFRYRYLDSAMSRDDANTSRARENCSTMLMRIYRLLEDSRFEFLFGPTQSEWPEIKHSLAAFIRDILGFESFETTDENHYTEYNKDSSLKIPFYDRQSNHAEKTSVVIVDLSLLSSEVLENVTAILGRLIHEFLQRLSDSDVSGINRGEFPVVLVLEEAQNYIREGHRLEEESISKQVFERIAREGRKYGLGLVVASQRPSELSKTVLSQCNSFIVHRLQNPEDIRYFKEIVPGIFDQLLDQLPALAPRTALVLGECVQAPAIAIMREVNPAPKSKNPKFYHSWTTDKPKVPLVEAVCSKWEGNDEPTK